ncbi:hypothetical protein DPMN_184797 [Dreissena polymorpha]|uniref:Uncharacterized protein n=1 Tax=Dreissena polymorpha TaxID=45954 RepID=A0A9D4DLJ4_DREPO|nr:hypothetical protein DPMN_184797 [Dreissena polymorpha]
MIFFGMMSPMMSFEGTDQSLNICAVSGGAGQSLTLINKHRGVLGVLGGTGQSLTLINKHRWYWSVTDHDQQRRLEQMTQGSEVVDVELQKG